MTADTGNGDGLSVSTAEQVERRASRDTIAAIHEQLRQGILSGAVPAESVLSQVRLANDFGVSRSSVREALRLLQREGLIDAELNRRVRVAGFSITDLESLYAMRIANESLAIRASVPRLERDDLAGLRRSLDQMDRLAGADIDEWESWHRRFHRGLVAHAGERFVRLTGQLSDHSERYRRVYISQGPRVWSVGAGEHREIYDACARREPDAAAGALARHLSRTALSVLGNLAPEHDPSLVRSAVRAATAESGVDGADTPGPL